MKHFKKQQVLNVSTLIRNSEGSFDLTVGNIEFFFPHLLLHLKMLRSVKLTMFHSSSCDEALLTMGVLMQQVALLCFQGIWSAILQML